VIEIQLDELASHKGSLCCYSPWLTITQDMIGARLVCSEPGKRALNTV